MEKMNKKKYNVVTLFSGYDSQCLALDRLGLDYDLVAWSEIDKNAIKAHNVLFPQYADRNLGDVTKIDWSVIDKQVDLLTYSSPCITEDMLILTQRGYIPMKDVCVGDMVLTKSNVMHKVVKKFDNGIHPTFFLNGMGCENIQCTGNHKFYVRTMSKKWDNSNRVYKRFFSEPTFLEASNLKKSVHYLGIPVNSRNEVFYREDEGFWYMVGMFVGDGWLSARGNEILICGNSAKIEKLSQRIPKDCKWTVNNRYKNCARLRFCDARIYAFLSENIGTGSNDKRIPYQILDMPIKQLSAFYEGYRDSDGCEINDNVVQFTSVNRNLIYSISAIINKIFHRPTCIYKNKVSPTTTIEGRVVNQQDWYQLRFRKNEHKQQQSFFEDGYIWFPFRELKPAGEAHVYNMEVEEDHSYILQGCVSKNCQDFSTAGLQRGGEAGSGTRSSLLWEVERAIVALRPRYLLLENVANLVGKKFYPLFMRWCKVLEGYGYHNTWQIMNAKDFGVPQNRKRVFLVSTLDQKPYYFPKPFELKKKLKDVLEKNVDERYYLSNERVEGLLKSTMKEKNAGRGFEFAPKTGEEDYSNSVTTNAGGRKTDNFIIEPRCLQVGNIVSTGNFENPQRGRVYDANGISPCLNTETGGGFRPKIVVDEDINDVSDKDKSTDVAVSEENIDGSHDTENNWNISEPSILTPKRTEYGKSVRKKYGDYNIPESRHNLTVLEPRQDGTSNTITTVAKDSMIVIGSMQKNAFVGPIDGVSPCINAACGMGGGQTPMVTEEIKSTIISPGHGYFAGAENTETCPTVKRSAMQEQHFVKEQEVLGWTRDAQGNIIDRHPVDVANCVTASKRDNTQNYVKEQVFLNGDSDGCACTITTTHDYSGNIINPKGGHKQMGVMEIIEDSYTSREPRHYTENSPTIRSEREGLKASNGIRVRKLTERELYRLMDVDDDNIDRLLASDIARTQHAKLAGNSIVVGCLYHIFDKMFLDKDVPTGEQTRLF